MRNRVALTIIGAALAALAVAGCATSRTTTVTGNPGSGFVTNVVVSVDTNNLALDSAIFQGAVAISASLVIQKDPSVVPYLRNAQVALDGVLNGSNLSTTAQVLAALKATNNPTLASEVTNMLAIASALEQKLLQKYGASVAGQISLELTRAADAGLLTALAGH